MPQRYTRGFPFDLGPMEACNDGEWIKAEEHEDIVIGMDAVICRLNQSVTALKGSLSDHKQWLKDAKNQTEVLETTCVVLSLVFSGIGLGIGCLL